MTNVVSVLKKCMHCGCETSFDVMEDVTEYGPPDLDTRPSETKRSTINFGVQRCPNCHYASDDISQLVPFDDGILKSERYLEIHNSSYPYNARSYMMASLIKESVEDYEKAAYFMLNACWVLDDNNIDSYEERLEAASLYLKGDLDQTTKLIVIDLYRRAESFDDAKELLDSEDISELPGGLKDCYDFERILIDKGDSDCHNFNEYSIFAEEVTEIQSDFGQIGYEADTDTIDEISRKLFDEDNQEPIYLPYLGDSVPFTVIGVIPVETEDGNRLFTLLQSDRIEENSALIFELFLKGDGSLQEMRPVYDGDTIDIVFDIYTKLVEEAS